MQTHLRGHDLITTQEWTRDEVDTIMDLAMDLKRARAVGRDHAYLRDKALAMLFFFSSTRTRASFEAGIAQLGGHGAFIDSDTTQISHGDTAKEIGEIFGRYFDGIAIRQCDWGFGNKYIREAPRPAASRVEHAVGRLPSLPNLADLMTIIEKKGDPRGKTIAVSYAYASSYQNRSACPKPDPLMTRYDMNASALVHPPEFKLMPDIVQQAKDNARKHNGSFEVMDDMDMRFKDADVVYPKELGLLDDDRGRKRECRNWSKILKLDHRRAPHGPGQTRCHLHALPARRPQH